MDERRGGRSEEGRAGEDRGTGHAEPVGDLVRRLLAVRGIAERVERASVVAEWDELVGPHIARIARPAGLRGATLFVEVESAAWRTELTLMRPELMRKLNAGKSRGRVEKIVFVQADGSVSEEGDDRVERAP